MSDKKRIHVSGEDYLEAVLLLKKSKDYVRSFEGEDIKKSLKKTAVALFQIQQIVLFENREELQVSTNKWGQVIHIGKIIVISNSCYTAVSEGVNIFVSMEEKSFQ